ncbi:hypothetical protein K435DRAFT_865602 [Dendrothele bispora CBS 962.96]|uniref:Uncharacterized protein n=1 Tax=Dendrothele bispora (strain CBS 962.96) TaxID=1314807 RepID=A0A4S8LKI0_DENBC|nr:hypothetical protein K435DRAFT_865602 [Dendrothele bispora CBS 962.96]
MAEKLINSVPMLSGTNFLEWKEAMTSLLHAQECWGIVTGRVTRPDVIDTLVPTDFLDYPHHFVSVGANLQEKKNDWDNTDDKTIGYIGLRLPANVRSNMNSFEDSQVSGDPDGHAKTSFTSKMLWDKIVLEYGTTHTPLKYQNFSDFMDWEFQEGKDPVPQFASLKQLLARLQLDGMAIPETFRGYHVLKALPRSYNNLKTTILSTNASLTLAIVEQTVTDEYCSRHTQTSLVSRITGERRHFNGPPSWSKQKKDGKKRQEGSSHPDKKDKKQTQQEEQGDKKNFKKTRRGKGGSKNKKDKGKQKANSAVHVSDSDSDSDSPLPTIHKLPMAFMTRPVLNINDFGSDIEILDGPPQIAESSMSVKQDKPNKLSKGQKRGEIRKFNKERELWAKAHKKVKDWQWPPHLEMTEEYDAAPRTHELFPAPPNWDQFIEKMEQPTCNENFSDQPLHWHLESMWLYEHPQDLGDIHDWTHTLSLVDSALDKSKWPCYGYEDFARMEQEDFDDDFKSWVKNGSASYYKDAPRVSSNGTSEPPEFYERYIYRDFLHNYVEFFCGQMTLTFSDFKFLTRKIYVDDEVEFIDPPPEDEEKLSTPPSSVKQEIETPVVYKNRPRKKGSRKSKGKQPIILDRHCAASESTINSMDVDWDLRPEAAETRSEMDIGVEADPCFYDGELNEWLEWWYRDNFSLNSPTDLPLFKQKEAEIKCGPTHMPYSGASGHFTYDIKDFAHYEAFDKPKPIQTADNKSESFMEGYGTVFVQHIDEEGQEQNITLYPGSKAWLFMLKDNSLFVSPQALWLESYFPRVKKDEVIEEDENSYTTVFETPGETKDPLPPEIDPELWKQFVKDLKGHFKPKSSSKICGELELPLDLEEFYEWSKKQQNKPPRKELFPPGGGEDSSTDGDDDDDNDPAPSSATKGKGKASSPPRTRSRTRPPEPETEPASAPPPAAPDPPRRSTRTRTEPWRGRSDDWERGSVQKIPRGKDDFSGEREDDMEMEGSSRRGDHADDQTPGAGPSHQSWRSRSPSPSSSQDESSIKLRFPTPPSSPPPENPVKETMQIASFENNLEHFSQTKFHRITQEGGIQLL